MIVNSLLALAPLLAVASAWSPASTLQTDILAAAGLLKQTVNSLTGGPHCRIEDVQIRREWTQLAPSERVAYTNAVRCLQQKPSKLPAGVAPGAKTRYDDFVAVHINQTFSIHGTTNFLSWHRMFTWSYEQALQNECGYTGSQAYWNWGKTAFDPVNSPMFDGSASSMGGNGVFEAHNCTDALPNHLNCIPPGQGGGCVTSGPFTGYTVDLAPVAPSLNVPEIHPGVVLGYQPRCLRRDVSVWVASNWTKDIDTYNLIVNSPDIAAFQNTMQGSNPAGGGLFANGFYGVHSAGHYTIGGDPGGDFFASPGDPAFFLHHAQIDRVWWIWQNQDLANRQNAIAGTITLFNDPPSRNGVLTDILDMGVVGPSPTIAQVMSTLGGSSGPGLCYVYL